MVVRQWTTIQTSMKFRESSATGKQNISPILLTISRGRPIWLFLGSKLVCGQTAARDSANGKTSPNDYACFRVLKKAWPFQAMAAETSLAYIDAKPVSYA